MSRAIKLLSDGAEATPYAIRHAVAPGLWRLALVLFWGTISFYVIPPSSPLWTSSYINDLNEVFKTLSGVFGVLAAFVSTSVTVIYTGDSSGARRMRSMSKHSLPRKLVYSALTLLALSFVLALFTPESIPPKLSLPILATAVSLAIIETVAVSALTLRAINETQEQIQWGRDPD